MFDGNSFANLMSKDMKGLELSREGRDWQSMRPRSAIGQRDKPGSPISPASSTTWRPLAAVPDEEEVRAAASPLSFLHSASADRRPVSAPPMRIDLFETSQTASNMSSVKGGSRRGSSLSNSAFSRRVPVSMVALLASSGSSHGSKFVASRPSSAASTSDPQSKPQWRTASNGHITVPRSAKLESKGVKREQIPAQKRTKDSQPFLTMKSKHAVPHPVELEAHALLLHNVPIFSDLPRDKVISIASSMKKQHCTFGTVLLRQDHPVQRLIVIQSGQVSVERKMLDGGKHCGILSSCLKKSGKGNAATPARVKVQTGLAGSVFGDYAALFDVHSNETVTVESISGAEILSISLSEIQQHLDRDHLVEMKERARHAAQFRQEQAKKFSQIMTSAVHQYSNRTSLYIPYPSQDELKKINRRMKQDVWHPIGWRNKQQDNQPNASRARPPRPQSAPPGQPAIPAAHRHTANLSSLPETTIALDVAGSRPGSPHDGRSGRRPSSPHGGKSSRPSSAASHRSVAHLHHADSPERERPASAMVRKADRDLDDDVSTVVSQAKRPSSAYVPSRKKWESGTPIWEANKYGECQDINYRKLFLSTWDLPERHTVYTGAKIAVSGAASDEVPHIELDIDALDDLEGTYLATFQ